SIRRNSSFSLSDATAALAMTKATVALSGLSLANVRLTQNFPGIVLVLPSLNPVFRMIAKNQFMSGQTAPRRKVLRDTGIGCGQLQGLSWRHRLKPHAKAHHQLAASHIPSIPRGVRERIGGGAVRRYGHGRLRWTF